MEEVIVVNEKDEVVGKMLKEEAHKNGTPHRVAFTYVENSSGQIVVQIRMNGRLDHSSAGHVNPGESYEEAAIRELEEELGIKGVSLKYLGKGVTEEILDDARRVHMFNVFKCVGEPGKLQEDEVKGVYWADPNEIIKEMQENPDDLKFCAGFRASLPIYLENRKT